MTLKAFFRFLVESERLLLPELTLTLSVIEFRKVSKISPRW